MPARRDIDPECELRLWERIAEKFCTLGDPADVPEARRELLRVLIACSANDLDVVRVTADYEHLSRKDVDRICEEWAR